MRKSSKKRRGMFPLMTPYRGREIPVKYIRLITMGEGESMVRRGSAERIHELGTESVVGYQLLAAGERPKKPQPVYEPRPPQASSTAFSKPEHEAIVGLRGESQTSKLSEQDRKSRVAAGFPEEDFIERARNKFARYALVH